MQTEAKQNSVDMSITVSEAKEYKELHCFHMVCLSQEHKKVIVSEGKGGVDEINCQNQGNYTPINNATIKQNAEFSGAQIQEIKRQANARKGGAVSDNLNLENEFYGEHYSEYKIDFDKKQIWGKPINQNTINTAQLDHYKPKKGGKSGCNSYKNAQYLTTQLNHRKSSKWHAEFNSPHTGKTIMWPQ